MNKHLFSVDPSLRACGWAMFTFNEQTTSAKYKRSGCVRSEGLEEAEDPVIESLKGKRAKANDWVSRIDETVEEVMDNARVRSSVGLIELPSTYSGGKGDAAAASGAIMKLMGVVFAFRQVMTYQYDFKKVLLVPVMTWKGQTKKEHTARRVLRAWGDLDITDHNEMDACGIADWYLRRLRNFKPHSQRRK